MITNRALSIKGIVFVVHITLAKSNIMQKLDGMNIIIQLKVQNHQNTFKATSTTTWAVISNAPKILKPGKT